MKKYLLNIWYTILYQFEQHRGNIPEWWYSNKPFEQYPAWMQRVAVAKDVIQQLNIGKYMARKGSYVRNVKIKKRNYDTPYDLRSADEDTDIKSTFEKLDNCQVCALGACLISITRFKNKLKWSNVLEYDNYYNSQSPLLKMLTSVFSPYQISMIECAFEDGRFNRTSSTRVGRAYNITLSEEDEAACQNFYCNYGDSEDVLRAIMQNIVDNKGTFKP